MKKIVLSGLAIALFVAIGVMVALNTNPKTPTESALGGEAVMVHKSPSCGCCGVYANYLRNQNVVMTVDNINDLTLVKTRLGVPTELMSCHTSEVGGYAIEGHVPLEVIEKLLSERPDIKGIGLPGMPSGTPGMPGPKTEDWIIYSFTEDGTVDVFMTL